jgi:hypothetical protein
MVGGALLGRAAVTLFDAARDHLPAADIVRRVAARGADVAMVAHVGSTQTHPACLRTVDVIVRGEEATAVELVEAPARWEAEPVRSKPAFSVK